jgi:hypothetical protein
MRILLGTVVALSLALGLTGCSTEDQPTGRPTRAVVLERRNGGCIVPF